jgi:DNA-binding response OmpR family regulator
MNTFGHHRVLVIDIEEAFCTAVADFLRFHGYEAYHATSVTQAVDILEVRHPDLLVLDAQVPAVDDPAHVQALMSDPQWVRTPQIILSARPTKPQWADASSALLGKPFTIDELLNAVNGALAPAA